MHMLSFIPQEQWRDVMNKSHIRSGYREVEDEKLIAYEVDVDSVKQLYKELCEWYGEPYMIDPP